MQRIEIHSSLDPKISNMKAAAGAPRKRGQRSSLSHGYKPRGEGQVGGNTARRPKTDCAGLTSS